MYRAARERAGLSREEAAFQLHVGNRTLANYELGDSMPPPDVVLNMSRLYKDPKMTSSYCRECCPIGQSYNYDVLNNISEDPNSVFHKLIEEVREVDRIMNEMFSLLINKKCREDFSAEEWSKLKLMK